MFDTKIAVVVRDDLAVWQKLNVASFLAGGLVGSYAELPGEPYRDASGQTYGKLIRQPILIFAADAAQLSAALQRAIARGLVPSIYTTALFRTGNDFDNRAAVASVPTEQLDLAGIALHGPRAAVDTSVKGLRLHN